MADDGLRAIASGTGSSDKKQEEEDLGDVQRMIEQAAKELQLDAEKTVEGIALEIFGIKNAFLFHYLFSADKSPTISYENNLGYSRACPDIGLMPILCRGNRNNATGTLAR